MGHSCIKAVTGRDAPLTLNNHGRNTRSLAAPCRGHRHLFHRKVHLHTLLLPWVSVSLSFLSACSWETETQLASISFLSFHTPEQSEHGSLALDEVRVQVLVPAHPVLVKFSMHLAAPLSHHPGIGSRAGSYTVLSAKQPCKLDVNSCGSHSHTWDRHVRLRSQMDSVGQRGLGTGPRPHGCWVVESRCLNVTLPHDHRYKMRPIIRITEQNQKLQHKSPRNLMTLTKVSTSPLGHPVLQTVLFLLIESF